MIIVIIANMYILMQISPSFLYDATWVMVSINTQSYASDIAVKILNATQLKAREYCSCRYVIKSWMTTELSTCHEHISHWFNILMSIIARTLNISWTHQSLIHNCHVSHSYNFENVMDTSVIRSLLSCQSFKTLEHVFTLA